VLIPLFVSGVYATEALLVERGANLDKAYYWIGFLGIYDAAALVMSLWIYESLVIE
jgi:hypothetical protein